MESIAEILGVALDIIAEDLWVAGDVERDAVEVVAEIDGGGTVVLDYDYAVSLATGGLVREIQIVVDR